MPRNGAGVYSAPNNTWNPPVNGVIATSTDWASTQADYVAALSQSVSADGQTPFTGNLPMGNNKITGLANGTAVTDAAAFGQVPHYVGQCRLTKSGANLLLSPFNGNQLVINGALQIVPSAGVTLAPGAFAAGTTYFIYAYMVGAVMTLEGSTTGHSTDVTTGVEIKTGDATRTLVGMARPIAGPLWVDTLAQRLVISWFNQRPISAQAFFTATRNVVTAGYTDLNAEIHNEILTWGTNSVTSSANGGVAHNTAGSEVRTCVGVDGGAQDGYSSMTAVTAGVVYPCAAYFCGPLTEGFHAMTLLANNVSGAGTASWIGSGTVGNRCTLSTVIQG